MSRVTLNIAARCDKAGRSQNQDNFWVCPDLTHPNEPFMSLINDDKDIDVSIKGTLLVVADGMGGMKSGEKASEFIIEGIRTKFSNIPEDILNNDNAIVSFIKEAIISADTQIKEFAKTHRESEGLGSTIVLLWILGDKAYCGWCGDSRIYCYNPQNSLVRLSHDHSYVQSLVDEGKITEDEAFDHPDGNIISRSLGDSGEKANPETKVYSVHRRDVFLLCSDGLCGLLPDSKIEEILSENCTSSKDALNALWSAGEKEGWTDNATIEVACVTDGGIAPTRKAVGYDLPVKANKPGQSKNGVKKETNIMPNFWQSNKRYILLLAVVVLIALLILWLFSGEKKSSHSSNQEFTIEQPEQGGNGSEDVGQDDNSDNQPSQPNKPDKPLPNKPGKPTQPQQPGQPQQPQQPQKPDAGRINDELQNQHPQTVTEDYLRFMQNTYNSIGQINQYIQSAQNRARQTGRGYLTSAEHNALQDFIANATDLNHKPDTKYLNEAQKKALGQINTVANKAKGAVRNYPIDDPRPQRVPVPGRGTGNPNQNNNNNNNTQDNPDTHGGNTYEDPIYITA